MTGEIWYSEKHENKAGITLKVTKTLYSGESEFQKIDVLETEAYGKMLLLDGLVMTTEQDEFFYHEMISHVPMISHPNPEKALVIGGGDGGTVREILKHPSIKEVVLCEVDGMVIDVSRKYFPSIAGMVDDPKVKITVQDGIKYIKEQNKNFDVILIDSTDPLGPGVGLFTEEFYTNVKTALRENGIMVAQTESPIACQKDFKLINNLLKKVFRVVKPYFAPVPTYPGAYWSWTFCSENIIPSIKGDKILINQIEKTAKYYNTEIHNSAFAVPNFVKKLISQENFIENIL